MNLTVRPVERIPLSVPFRDRVAFGSTLLATLVNRRGPYRRTPEDATALALFLLPDILTINTASAAGFLNGRRLRDDVLDTLLGLYTNGAVTTDFLADDNETRITDGMMGTVAAFPYIGPPNEPPQGPNP